MKTLEKFREIFNQYHAGFHLAPAERFLQPDGLACIFICNMAGINRFTLPGKDQHTGVLLVLAGEEFSGGVKSYGSKKIHEAISSGTLSLRGLLCAVHALYKDECGVPRYSDHAQQSVLEEQFIEGMVARDGFVPEAVQRHVLEAIIKFGYQQEWAKEELARLQEPVVVR